MWYVILWILIFIKAGAWVYVIDRKIGTKIYGVWFRWTRPRGAVQQKEIGLVYHRRNRFRWTVAFFASSIQSWLMVKHIGVDLEREIIMWLVEIPAMMIGFMLGPWLMKLIKGRDALFEAADQVESGEIDLGKVIAAKFAAIKGWFKARVAWFVDLFANLAPRKKVANPPAQPVAVTPSEPELSPQEMMDRYIKRDKGGQK